MLSGCFQDEHQADQRIQTIINNFPSGNNQEVGRYGDCVER